MRLCFVFHKNPLAPETGIDVIRLRALSKGLAGRGIRTEIVAPVQEKSSLDGIIPVHPAGRLQTGRYDLVKTCYHFSAELIGSPEAPVISRIVRVVDSELPERDGEVRERLIRCQEIIAERASAVVLNNRENMSRWRSLYGPRLPVAIIPTGCPSTIPPPGKNPYREDDKVILFLGSLAAPRMIRILNETAILLEGAASVHYIGADKTRLYGGQGNDILSPLIVRHGELPEHGIWDYIRHARIGIVPATGPHPFDNDMSKIYSYLRGGLPVLSEEPVVNNHLIRETGLGDIFRYGDTSDLAAKALQLLTEPSSSLREAAMEYMVKEHSWERRVEAYLDLFLSVIPPR